jgi:hypothetical protein
MALREPATPGTILENVPRIFQQTVSDSGHDRR